MVGCDIYLPSNTKTPITLTTSTNKRKSVLDESYLVWIQYDYTYNLGPRRNCYRLTQDPNLNPLCHEGSRLVDTLESVNWIGEIWSRWKDFTHVIDGMSNMFHQYLKFTLMSINFFKETFHVPHFVYVPMTIGGTKIYQDFVRTGRYSRWFK